MRVPVGSWPRITHDGLADRGQRQAGLARHDEMRDIVLAQESWRGAPRGRACFGGQQTDEAELESSPPRAMLRGQDLWRLCAVMFGVLTRPGGWHWVRR